jgi:hypothetical protein
MNPGTSVLISVLTLVFCLVWVVTFAIRYLRSKDYNRRVSSVRRLGLTVAESERIAKLFRKESWADFYRRVY